MIQTIHSLSELAKECHREEELLPAGHYENNGQE
jgi:hypothetical protein